MNFSTQFITLYKSCVIMTTVSEESSFQGGGLAVLSH